MEFGDIIYLILMLAFFVFGIFNDSRKKKKTISKSTPPVPPQPPTPGAVKRKSRRATPAVVPAGNTRREFRSSLDLVTDFEGESSLRGSLFASGLSDSRPEMKTEETVHPILEQLRGENRQDEIRKAVIYSEILNRKY